MANCKRKPVPNEPDLTQQSDFQLLNAFASLVSKENSQCLKLIAWEIMCRYSSHLDKSNSTKTQGHNTTLGDARWGDAKRVEAIYGIKRGVLLRLAEEGTVIDCSLESEITHGGASKSIRAKRMYCLVSIAEHLKRKAANKSN